MLHWSPDQHQILYRRGLFHSARYAHVRTHLDILLSALLLPSAHARALRRQAGWDDRRPPRPVAGLGLGHMHAEGHVLYPLALRSSALASRHMPLARRKARQRVS